VQRGQWPLFVAASTGFPALLVSVRIIIESALTWPKLTGHPVTCCMSWSDSILTGIAILPQVHSGASACLQRGDSYSREAGTCLLPCHRLSACVIVAYESTLNLANISPTGLPAVWRSFVHLWTSVCHQTVTWCRSPSARSSSPSCTTGNQIRLL